MHKVFFPVSKSQPCKVKRYLEIFLLSSSVFCLDICFKQLNFGGTNWWNSNPWNISISTIHDFQCYESVSKRLHTYAPTSIAHFYCLKLKYIFLDNWEKWEDPPPPLLRAPRVVSPANLRSEPELSPSNRQLAAELSWPTQRELDRSSAAAFSNISCI